MNISTRNISKIILAGLLMHSHLLMAEPGIFNLSSGIDFSSGKYGASKSTDITYIPLTGKYETGDWLFKLTVPYISVTGPANTTANIGQAVYKNNDVRTDAGMGDVVASSSYSLVNSARSGMLLDVTGKVKFGTAEKYKGLGSGANDYATESSLYKIFERRSVFGTVGYKVFGASQGYSLNNVFYGSLGFSQKIDNQVSTGLIVDYRQATTVWSDPQKMWTVFLNKKIDSKWKMQTYLFSGSGTSSPDFGGGAMFIKTMR